MNNYKLTIQYDGTNFHGWQSQNNAVTIQEVVTKGIEILVREKINLIGAGRTDRGVHALGQVANFRTEADPDLYRFKHALNGILPKEIAVKKIEKVNEDFHARFDAKSRTYWYLITRMKSPFYYKYSYLYPHNVDTAMLTAYADRFLGEHDFTGFAKELPQTDHCLCNIYSAQWKRFQNVLLFRIEANRYLHGMVRSIVGTMLTGLKHHEPAEWINEIIDAKDRNRTGYAVPSNGLYLTKIQY